MTSNTGLGQLPHYVLTVCYTSHTTLDMLFSVTNYLDFWNAIFFFNY